MTELVLSGGTLVLEDRAEVGTIAVRDGRIAEIGSAGASRAAEVVDCAGAYVFPGLIDFHVHLDDRIGQFALADTWATGSAAALPTGVTSLVSFATQRPGGAESVVEAVDAVLARARGRSRCDYALHVTPTHWDDEAWRALETLSSRGQRSVKLYTTYGAAGLLAGDDIIESVLARAVELDLTVLLHCEDDTTLRRASADPALGWAEALTHAKARPPEAELRAVETAIALCRKTGGRLHIVHVSTPAAAKLIRKAAAELPLSCETCPQYLALDESKLAGPDGFSFICSPPLRSPGMRAGMLELARSGAFDLIATDHCAFSRADKAVGAGRDVRKTPNGLAGLGALAPICRELLVDDPADARSLCGFARMLSTAPAKLAGLFPKKGSLRVGADADIVVARLDAAPEPIRSTTVDAHEPYAGWRSRWRADRVYMRGALAARDGQIVPGGPLGEPAWAE